MKLACVFVVLGCTTALLVDWALCAETPGDVPDSHDWAGPIRYQKRSRSIAPSKAPGGCDVVLLKYLILSGSAASQADWKDAKFNYCQLPPAWRVALAVAAPGEEIEYLVPKELVPRFYAVQLGIEVVDDVEVHVRIINVRAGPAGLAFPRTDFPSRKRRTTDGLAYVQLAPGTGDHPATVESALALQQTTWLKDGTLLSSTLLGPTPVVVDLRRAPGFLKEVLVNASDRAQFIVWLPPEPAIALQERLLEISVIKVFR